MAIFFPSKTDNPVPDVIHKWLANIYKMLVTLSSKYFLFVVIQEEDLGEPLLPTGQTDVQNNNPVVKLICSGVYTVFFTFFYFLCSLTGQLPIKPTKFEYPTKIFVVFLTALTAILMLTFVCTNVFALLFDLYVIIWCPYKPHCEYINSINRSNMIWAESISDGSESLNEQPMKLNEFYNWKKTVITTATFSGTVSYLFMVCVLYSQYSVFKASVCDRMKTCIMWIWKSCGQKIERKMQGVLLSPFNDDNNCIEATKLTPKQATYFMTIFFFNMIVYSANAVLFFIIFGRSVDDNQNC